MEKERVKRILVELYNEFQNSLIEAEKKKWWVVRHKKRGIARYVRMNKRIKNLWFDNEDEPIYAIFIPSIGSEIIGLPVELNHLLMAMNYCNEFHLPALEKLFLNYSLSRTVEQNLNENEELRKFISELIFNKQNNG